MADARALLRQQRAARRIDHPHALYTETGKLSCNICHETLRSDSLWDGHVRSLGHRQRILAQQKARGVNDNAAAPIPERRPKSTGGGKETLSDEALLAQIISGAGGQKRKHGKQEEEGDVTMADAGEGQDEFAATGNNNTEGEYDDNDDDENDSAEPRLHKRSKPSSDSGTIPPGPPSTTNGRIAVAPSAAGSPPDLLRRASGTPSHGVELQIPSRPATPSASATSTNSTPKATSVNRGPLGPALEGGSSEGSLKQAPRAAFATTTTITNDTIASTGGRAPSSSITIAGAPPTTATNNDDEDDEWAAFEAEVVKATGPAAPPTTVTTGTTNNDAVITAQPMTAEQIAAQRAEDDQQTKKTKADIEIADDKEEATRALETEFEEMEELEARVRRLREKREALRRGSLGAAVDGGGGGGGGNGDVQEKGTGTATEKAAIVSGSTGQNVQEATEDDKKDDDDEDDDDDDDEDDDWAGFRFRA